MMRQRYGKILHVRTYEAHLNGYPHVCLIVVALWLNSLLSRSLLWFYVFWMLPYRFISMLYMYALAFSSFSMLFMLFAMQYSPYWRLNVENTVSTAQRLP